MPGLLSLDFLLVIARCVSHTLDPNSEFEEAKRALTSLTSTSFPQNPARRSSGALLRVHLNFGKYPKVVFCPYSLPGPSPFPYSTILLFARFPFNTNLIRNVSTVTVTRCRHARILTITCVTCRVKYLWCVMRHKVALIGDPRRKSSTLWHRNCSWQNNSLADANESGERMIEMKLVKRLLRKEDSKPTKNVACLRSPLKSWFEAMTILESLHKTPVSKL